MVRDVVTRYLERDGHRVVTAADSDRARALIEREPPSIVLLDVMLPGETDGLALCRWIRSASELPVILLTARTQEPDPIVALQLAAHAYAHKPPARGGVATRVSRVPRRRGPRPPPLGRISIGSLVVDAAARQAFRDGAALPLTAKEFDLLWFLASHPNRVFSRDQLMSGVWG